MVNYCTVADIESAYRDLTEKEEARANALIPTVSAELRLYAAKLKKDLDVLIDASDDYGLVVKAVTVDTVMRIINQSTTAEGMSQMSQSAGGYSVSGTFLVPGGGTLILNRDLKRLGLSSQKIGLLDVYGNNNSDVVY